MTEFSRPRKRSKSEQLREAKEHIGDLKREIEQLKSDGNQADLIKLLGLAVELINQIEKNAGLADLIDLSAGTGMTHLGYMQFKKHARKILKNEREPKSTSSPC